MIEKLSSFNDFQEKEKKIYRVVHECLQCRIIRALSASRDRLATVVALGSHVSPCDYLTMFRWISFLIYELGLVIKILASKGSYEDDQMGQYAWMNFVNRVDMLTFLAITKWFGASYLIVFGFIIC